MFVIPVLQMLVASILVAAVLLGRNNFPLASVPVIAELHPLGVPLFDAGSKKNLEPEESKVEVIE